MKNIHRIFLDELLFKRDSTSVAIIKDRKDQELFMKRIYELYDALPDAIQGLFSFQIKKWNYCVINGASITTVREPRGLNMTLVYMEEFGKMPFHQPWTKVIAGRF